VLLRVVVLERGLVLVLVAAVVRVTVLVLVLVLVEVLVGLLVGVLAGVRMQTQVLVRLVAMRRGLRWVRVRLLPVLLQVPMPVLGLPRFMHLGWWRWLGKLGARGGRCGEVVAPVHPARALQYVRRAVVRREYVACVKHGVRDRQGAGEGTVVVGSVAQHQHYVVVGGRLPRRRRGRRAHITVGARRRAHRTVG